jgi:hypothetical protein
VPASEDAPLREVDLSELEARCKAATPGPWKVLSDPDVACSWLNADQEEDQAAIALFDYRPPEANLANAQFSMQAREDVPRLIAEVRALRGRVRELLEANGKEVERRTQATRERDEALAKLGPTDKAKG